MENHNLDHLGTTAMTEEVFPQEGMHEMLSKKRSTTDKVSDKRKWGGGIPRSRESSLDVLKNRLTSLQ